jgi:hypothetical protein
VLVATRRKNTADADRSGERRARDARSLAALAAETHRHLDDLIRRRLALPLAARMNFLRRRLPGGGSSL